MYSWTLWEQLFLPNHALKYISHLLWLIAPKSVWSCPIVFFFISFVLAFRHTSSSQNPHAKPSGSWQTGVHPLLVTGWKKVLSLRRVPLKWKQNSPFHGDGSFFRTCISLLPVKGFCEFLHLKKIFLFLFIPTDMKVAIFYVPGLKTAEVLWIASHYRVSNPTQECEFYVSWNLHMIYILVVLPNLVFVSIRIDRRCCIFLILTFLKNLNHFWTVQLFKKKFFCNLRDLL